MNENDILNNTYGISNLFKIIIIVMNVFSIPIIIYLFVRYVSEIDTFWDQKYLIIILIIYLEEINDNKKSQLRLTGL
jgi:hypothetical protein